MVKDIKQHLMEKDRFARYVGILVEEATPEYARVSMPLGENQRNGVNLAHGGAIFTLADLAFAAIANAGSESVALNAQTSISFLRGGSHGPLVAEARMRHSGRTLLTVDVDVRDADGALLATAVCTGCRTTKTIAS